MSLSLTDDLKKIKGVGPKIEIQLNSLNIFTIEDLIFHLPIRYENKTRLNEIRDLDQNQTCLLYTSPSPRDGLLSRMPSSA